MSRVNYLMGKTKFVKDLKKYKHPNKISHIYLILYQRNTTSTKKFKKVNSQTNIVLCDTLNIFYK